MLRAAIAVLLCLTSLAALARELPPGPNDEEIYTSLAGGTDVEVLSINPYPVGRGELNPERAFHGYEILGRATLSPAESGMILAATRKTLSHQGDPPMCFIPRHGLRYRYQNSTYEFLICFECDRIFVYRDGERIAFFYAGYEGFDEYRYLVDEHKLRKPER